MGKQQSKEEQVIIAQTASGGNNQSSLEHLNYHASFTTSLLAAICVILALALLYFGYRQYSKCHRRWIQREILENHLRRSNSWFRRREANGGDSNDRAGANII